MDSTLVWPYYTKVVVCAVCRHKFVTRYYGEMVDNLVAGLNDTHEVLMHVKNCRGNRG